MTQEMPVWGNQWSFAAVAHNVDLVLKADQDKKVGAAQPGQRHSVVTRQFPRGSLVPLWTVELAKGKRMICNWVSHVVSYATNKYYYLGACLLYDESRHWNCLNQQSASVTWQHLRTKMIFMKDLPNHAPPQHQQLAFFWIQAWVPWLILAWKEMHLRFDVRQSVNQRYSRTFVSICGEAQHHRAARMAAQCLHGTYNVVPPKRYKFIG